MEPAAVIASLLAVTTVVAGVAWAQRGRSLDRATAVIHGLRDERMAQARTLAERDADQGALLDALDEGVIRVDAADRVTEADRRAHLLLGYEPGALLGRSLMEAFMDPAVEALATRTRNGSTGAMTVELRPSSPDGTAVTVRARATPTDGSLWLVLEDVSDVVIAAQLAVREVLLGVLEARDLVLGGIPARLSSTRRMRTPGPRGPRSPR